MVSMRKMQELGPILKTLKEKYKGGRGSASTRRRLNLYKTYKINPLSGCLPMLAQIPRLHRPLQGAAGHDRAAARAVLLWVNDLSAPEHLWDIAVAGYTVPIRLLPLLMGVSMFVQQKMTPSAGMEPAQQKMMLFMPRHLHVHVLEFPDRARHLLAGQQRPRDRQQMMYTARRRRQRPQQRSVPFQKYGNMESSWIRLRARGRLPLRYARDLRPLAAIPFERNPPSLP